MRKNIVHPHFYSSPGRAIQTKDHFTLALLKYNKNVLLGRAKIAWCFQKFTIKSQKLLIEIDIMPAKFFGEILSPYARTLGIKFNMGFKWEKSRNFPKSLWRVKYWFSHFISNTTAFLGVKNGGIGTKNLMLAQIVRHLWANI